MKKYNVIVAIVETEDAEMLRDKAVRSILSVDYSVNRAVHLYEKIDNEIEFPKSDVREHNAI